MAHASSTAALTAALKSAFPGSEDRIEGILAEHGHPSVDAHQIAQAIKAEVFGHDALIDRFARKYACHAGNGSGWPFSVLLVGSPGGGTATLARTIASAVSRNGAASDQGDPSSIIVWNMRSNPDIESGLSTLLGTPKGYSGAGPGWLQRRNGRPGVVILEGLDRATGSATGLISLLEGKAESRYDSSSIEVSSVVFIATAEVAPRVLDEIVRSSQIGDQIVEDVLREHLLHTATSSSAEGGWDRAVLRRFRLFEPVLPLGAAGTVALVLSRIEQEAERRGFVLGKGSVSPEALVPAVTALFEMEGKGLSMADRLVWLDRKVLSRIREAEVQSGPIVLGWKEGEWSVASATPKRIDGKADFLAVLDAMEAIAIGGGPVPASEDGFWPNQARLAVRAICAWLADSDIQADGTPMPEAERAIIHARENVLKVLGEDDTRLNAILELHGRGAFRSIRGFDKVGLGLLDDLVRTRASRLQFAGTIGQVRSSLRP